MDAIAEPIRDAPRGPRVRALLLATLLPLLAMTVGATLLAIVGGLDRATRAQLETRLERGAVGFAEVWAMHESLYRAEARALSQSPRLREVAASPEAGPEALRALLSEHASAIGAALLLVTDADGRLLAMVPAARTEPSASELRPLLERALTDGDASAAWVLDATALQVQARPLWGGEHARVIVVGHSIDREILKTVGRQTAHDIALVADGRVIADTLPRFVGDASEALRGAGSSDASEVELGGGRFLAVAAAVPGYEGEGSLHYVTLSSLDRALAPGRRLTRAVIAIGALSLLLGIALALGLGRRLARPLEHLVLFSQHVTDGELDASAVLGPAFREAHALAASLHAMIGSLERARRARGEEARADRDREIAAQLQDSILPHRVQVEGLDVAARVVPSGEVGGDFYDVVPEGRGRWIAIGDVAGRGLPAGVVMVMAQTALASMLQEHPDAGPAEILERVNRVLYASLRERLDQQEHIRFCLLRHDGEGRLRYSGAHEEMLLMRSGAEQAEVVETDGTWLGLVEDIGDVTKDRALVLEEGDALVLFTDGVTDARDARGELLGLERVKRFVEQAPSSSGAADLCARVIELATRGAAPPEDDVTVLVLKRPVGA